MAETPRNEQTKEAADLVGAARDRGLEHLEGAKAQLAEGAERAADAVERTADELDGEGDSRLSGFGHSMANVMRQLAGGLRERDVEAFAHELGALARRNPGVFLAGSVALGFGMARFFKARAPQLSAGTDYGRQGEGAWQGSNEGASAPRDEFDADESLDLSAGSSQEKDSGQASATAREDDRSQSKSRQSSKQKAKAQRASSGGSQPSGAASPASSTNERPQPDTSPTAGSSGTSDSPFTGGTGGGALRGGKS